jgi:hypothetical protein
VNPDDELEAADVEVFSDEEDQFSSLHPWGSDKDLDSHYTSDFSNADSLADSFSSDSLASLNSVDYWDDLGNSFDEMANDPAFNARRSPSMPPPPRLDRRAPGKRGKKPMEETIRYPLMLLEGGKLVDPNWYKNFPSSSSESAENDMRWQVGEDVRFAISADDNFDGRDVNVHLNLPDDWNQEHGHGGAGAHKPRRAH